MAIVVKTSPVVPIDVEITPIVSLGVSIVPPIPVAPTRVQIVATFTDLNGNLFDPQIVIFQSIFTPGTIGLLPIKTMFTFGATSDISHLSTGTYAVVMLLGVAGKLNLSWQSTAVGEENVSEQVVVVTSQTVVA